MTGEIKAIETVYKGIRFRSRLEARYAVLFDTVRLVWDYETEGHDLGPVGKYLPDFIVNFPWVNKQFYLEVKPTFPEMRDIEKMSALCKGKQMQGGILFGSLYPPRINTFSLNLLIKKISDSKNPVKYTYQEVFSNIVSGVLMVHFNKDGSLLPDCETFAYTDGGKCFDIWTYYVNPEVTFEKGEEIFPKELPLLYGKPMLALSVPGSDNAVFNKIGETLFHPRIYIGRGVTYNNKELQDAYSKARSARFEHGESG